MLIGSYSKREAMRLSTLQPFTSRQEGIEQCSLSIRTRGTPYTRIIVFVSQRDLSTSDIELKCFATADHICVRSSLGHPWTPLNSFCQSDSSDPTDRHSDPKDDCSAALPSSTGLRISGAAEPAKNTTAQGPRNRTHSVRRTAYGTCSHRQELPRPEDKSRGCQHLHRVPISRRSLEADPCMPDSLPEK